MADLFAGIPRRSPADLVALAREQGVPPLTRFEDLLGKWDEGEDDLDVDAFLGAREESRAEELRGDNRLTDQ